jgi:hypothetical protein
MDLSYRPGRPNVLVLTKRLHDSAHHAMARQSQKEGDA